MKALVASFTVSPTSHNCFRTKHQVGMKHPEDFLEVNTNF